MAPTSRKRRAPADEDAPTPTQTQRRQDTPEEDELDDEEQDGSSGSGGIAQLSKNLVRYALACEYSRIPIKRQDVSHKVLGTHARSFRQVFNAANDQLKDVFGMRMVELPNREKVTARQKRAAASSESQPKNSNMWVLQNILPEQYRLPDVIGPGREPDEDDVDMEGAYVGLYTTIVSLILLSGGSLKDVKLDRFLKRMNADDSTPVDNTEKLFARMIKEGYIVKVKDSSSGEEEIEYVVGPRGKVEVGKEGAANFVRTVFGTGVDDLEQRLARSLGLNEAGEEQRASIEATEPARRPGRPRRRGSEDD